MAMYPTPEPALALISGYLSGKYIEPDLDIDHITESEQRVYQDFGFLVGWLWSKYWWPYAKAIPHRSPLSHVPLLSTFLRMVYAMVPAQVGWLFMYSNPTDWILNSWQPLLLYYLGLAQADLIHITADFLHVHKKRKRH